MTSTNSSIASWTLLNNGIPALVIPKITKQINGSKATNIKVKT